MLLEKLFWGTLVLSIAVIVYHHAIYPSLILFVSRFIKPKRSERACLTELPSMTVIVPAYREAKFIQAKIDDLIAVSYPREKLQVIIATDGSPDETPSLARDALLAAGAKVDHIKLVCFAANRGKVAVLNELIGGSFADVVVLSDASAITPSGLLVEVARSFSDPSVGVVCPAYALDRPASAGEASYWRYQSSIKIAEAAIAAPMGAHGATYAIRRNLWKPLPADVINDDFVLPMRIVSQGYRAEYRSDLVVGEREETLPQQENGRRRRIGAGNLQQVWMCRDLLWSNSLSVAFLFVSGKVLRALMPAIMAVAFLVSLGLAKIGSGTAALLPLAISIVILQIALATAIATTLRNFAIFAQIYHVLNGYFQAGRGIIDLLTNSFADERRQVNGSVRVYSTSQNRLTCFAKRLFDIIIAIIVFVVFLIILPFVALAVKISSPGPVFYKQLRVGRMLTDRTELFDLIKFRTMNMNAENGTGAVWASKGDPRVTPIGRFLRKTRLDELPQCINVLRGEMSIVGPRPERPAFFMKLESAIPFYIERTYGLKPGVTGLAQVSTGYDATIDDVKLKVLFDHTYAARTDRLFKWLATDVTILWRTIWVMGLGMGR